MKKLYLLGLCLGMTLSSCKKDKTTETPAAAKQSDQQGSSAADSGVDDVNDFVSNKIGGGSTKRMAAYSLPCGVVSVDSTTSSGHKEYTFKYGSKTPCGYKYKSGNISFHLVKGASFAETGAVSAITFTDYTVQSNASGDVIKVNGTLYTTNVSGGYIWQSVVSGATIVHRLRGSFVTTYANGETRAKNYFQLRTWSSSNGWAGLTFTMAGDTVINSGKVSETGKTYDGNYDYRTEMIDNFQLSNCGSTFAGPYVLKTGTARLNVTIPNVSPAYFQVEAGYYYVSAQATPEKKNDCSSNAYKITTVTGKTTKTEYQLY